MPSLPFSLYLSSDSTLIQLWKTAFKSPYSFTWQIRASFAFAYGFPESKISVLTQLSPSLFYKALSFPKLYHNKHGFTCVWDH